MKADVEVRLFHDGKDWVAEYGTVMTSGNTLHELDDNLARVLRQSGDFPPATEVTVFMGFDFDTIPTWLRQYHSHYFNRYIALNL